MRDPVLHTLYLIDRLAAAPATALTIDKLTTLYMMLVQLQPTTTEGAFEFLQHGAGLGLPGWEATVEAYKAGVVPVATMLAGQRPINHTIVDNWALAVLAAETADMAATRAGGKIGLARIAATVADFMAR